MEIKIDTVKDSKEDIKKMIEFLHRFISETSDQTYQQSYQEVGIKDDAVVPGAMNMFDSAPGEAPKKKEKPRLEFY